MPIKPENKKRYPSDWPHISACIIKRANNRCEWCQVPNHAVGYRNAQRLFVPCGGNAVLDAYGAGTDKHTQKQTTYKQAKQVADWLNELNPDAKYFVVVLTVAHMDHRPENCHPKNLKALCQKCHNTYDKPHRKETVRQSKHTGQLTIEF